MKPDELLHADSLDIVFENRHKGYGAYVLRREYPARLLQALGAVTISVALGALLFYLLRDQPRDASPQAAVQWLIDSVVLSPFDPPPPPPPRQPIPPPVAEVAFTTPVLTLLPMTDPPPDMSQLEEDAQIGTRNQTGIPLSQSLLPGEAPHPLMPERSGAAETPLVLERAERMPLYPGGMDALYRFVQWNLHVELDESAGVNRMEIRCRFVVDEEGRVTNIEVLHSSGRTEWDEELKRVVAKMPQWIPGSQQGKKVRVYFTLPVVITAPGE